MNQQMSNLPVFIEKIFRSPADLSHPLHIHSGRSFHGTGFALFSAIPITNHNENIEIPVAASVVGLGFGMNLFEALKAGKEGIVFHDCFGIRRSFAGYPDGRDYFQTRKDDCLSDFSRNRHMWRKCAALRP